MSIASSLTRSDSGFSSTYLLCLRRLGNRSTCKRERSWSRFKNPKGKFKVCWKQHSKKRSEVSVKLTVNYCWAWAKTLQILQVGKPSTCGTTAIKKQSCWRAECIRGNRRQVLCLKGLCNFCCPIQTLQKSSAKILSLWSCRCSTLTVSSRATTAAVFLDAIWTANGPRLTSTYMQRSTTQNRWLGTFNGNERYSCTATCMATAGSRTHSSSAAVIKTTSKKVGSRTLSWGLSPCFAAIRAQCSHLQAAASG